MGMITTKTYKCDTCQKTTIKQVDEFRPFINKCTITYQCTGQLLEAPADASSNPKSLAPWRSRFDPVATSSAQSVDPILSLMDGTQTLSLFLQSDPSVAPTSVSISLLIKETRLTRSQEYNYLYSATVLSKIAGVDNSPTPRALRFSSSDKIKLYINGVLLDPSQYSTNVANTITLGTPRTDDVISVKVLVYQETEGTSKTLTFTKDAANCAWGNVSSVKAMNATFTRYTCSDLSTLVVNESFTISSIISGSLQTPSYFALSYSPHTAFDRVKDALVDINQLITDNVVFLYAVNTRKQADIVINMSHIKTNIFPPIQITGRLSDDPVTASSQSDTTNIIDNPVIL